MNQPANKLFFTGKANNEINQETKSVIKKRRKLIDGMLNNSIDSIIDK